MSKFVDTVSYLALYLCLYVCMSVCLSVCLPVQMFVLLDKSKDERVTRDDLQLLTDEVP